jgi:hypothetical protein
LPQLCDTEAGTKPVNMADKDNDWLHEVRPVPRKKVLDDMGHARVMMILKNQRLEIEEVIETIQDNINQWRSDLDVCIPELKSILYGLMEDHFSFIKHLASMLGGEHPMIRIIDKESDHLINAANEMMYQANVIIREDETSTQITMLLWPTSQGLEHQGQQPPMV